MKYHFLKSLLLVTLLVVFGCARETSSPDTVDFNAALEGLNFYVSDDSNGVNGGNGIPEGIEMALVAQVLNSAGLDLSAGGGVSQVAARAAYQQALESAREDLGLLLHAWPGADLATVGYVMLGEESFAAIDRMSAGFGAPLRGDYRQALALDRYFSAAGDADGDGFSNIQEYAAIADGDLDTYLAAALDPRSFPSEAPVVTARPAKETVVGVVLYPGFEVLDVYGPVEIWSYVTGFRIVLIAEEAGPVVSAQGTSTIATHSFESTPPLDILMVPGGNGSRGQVYNPALLDFLVKVNTETQFTTSVCTGSALLARAGILDGHRATTNKRAFYLAEQQSDKVDWVVEARWVESGKMFTSSGVSAGTDMALALVAKIQGVESARELARSLEYTWHETAESDPFAQYVNRLTVFEAGRYELVKSEPAANGVSPAAPRYLRLYFSASPDIGRSRVALHRIEDNSVEIPLGDMHTMGNNDLMLRVDRLLEPGSYRVRWVTAFSGSEDTVSGAFEFEVAPASPGRSQG